MLQLVLLTDLLCGYYHNCQIELKMGGINAIKKIFANLGKKKHGLHATLKLLGSSGYYTVQVI